MIGFFILLSVIYGFFILCYLALILKAIREDHSEKQILKNSRGRFWLHEIEIDCYNERGYWDYFGFYHSWDDTEHDDLDDEWFEYNEHEDVDYD